MKKILLILTILISVGVGLYYFIPSKKLFNQSPKNGTSSDLVEMGESSLGFSLRLPSTFSQEGNGQFSRLYSKKTATSGAGPSNFIYISVIPSGKELSEGEIYNYNARDLQIFNDLDVDETGILAGVTDKTLSSYYTYKRIDDAMVGGYGTKAFKNEKPWEFPDGTVEYRYIVPFMQATFLIGAYTGEDSSSQYHIGKGELDELLKGLKLTPDTFTTTFTSPIPEGEWEKFSNTTLGISFEYPSGWTKREGGQNFPEGDLFNLTAIGQTQRPQTELYDGVSFSVMKPISFNGNLSDWIKKRYEDQAESKPEYSQVTFGGKTYEKVIVCGLGCFTYYHTVQNNKLYGFVVNVVGPHESFYESVVSKIISKVIYN